MALTVGELIALPSVKTWSLTPGVGEQRKISWAHSCEQPDPWLWLGEGSLVMTTGLGVPVSVADQCTYFAGMHKAGIAAVTIGAHMSAPPLAEEALAYASSLGLPVLETAYEVPFLTLATAVIEAAQEQRARRVRLTERMYAALRTHATEEDSEPLLTELSALLGGTFAIEPALPGGARGSIEEVEPGRFTTSLVAPGDPVLSFKVVTEEPDYGLLQHSAGIVGTALSISAASRRRDWLYGSILLGNLADGTMPAGFARGLLESHGLSGSLRFCVWAYTDGRESLDAVQAVAAAEGSAAIATVKDHQTIALIRADDSALLDRFGEQFKVVGASAPFTDLLGFQTAVRQASVTLTRARTAEQTGAIRFDDAEPSSLFLPSDGDQLRAITQQVLGPLQEYDAQRGTDLMETLRVFLEDNRSWVRASERLFIHRQTLVSRIARIESVLGKDLGKMQDASDCWLAIRAAVRCGALEPEDI
ncbi:PucR family transcriptional regulator ligand-binding domain-containing protein [Leucobacter sp. cx-328]|uniref:PucR family transcriptional regulator n=1 Tax=unclassified Leucobacter TaxID=2621730 RepID=UPI00165D8580|nr:MULTISPECIES: PucR family transcriptional regulator [unclassified Leucobacter]MBC9943679.1 PucR family transcriptional regulator ligand-binding domain-containing protein [Leucobacter sp. cx-328]